MCGDLFDNLKGKKERQLNPDFKIALEGMTSQLSATVLYLNNKRIGQEDKQLTMINNSNNIGYSKLIQLINERLTDLKV